jgi:hypothetical protein
VLRDPHAHEQLRVDPRGHCLELGDHIIGHRRAAWVALGGQRDLGKGISSEQRRAVLFNGDGPTHRTR